MSRNFSCIWNPQINMYVLKFDSDKMFVDFLKKTVPGNMRDYDSQTREWFLHDSYYAGIYALAEAILKPKGYNFYAFTRTKAEEFNQPEQQIVPVKTYFAEFVNLAQNAGETVTETIDMSAASKLYRKLAMYYHPDRSPNDPNQADAMARLNVAWKELKNGYWASKS